jgi:hypothetical protein
MFRRKASEEKMDLKMICGFYEQIAFLTGAVSQSLLTPFMSHGPDVFQSQIATQ